MGVVVRGRVQYFVVKEFEIQESAVWPGDGDFAGGPSRRR